MVVREEDVLNVRRRVRILPVTYKHSPGLEFTRLTHRFKGILPLLGLPGSEAFTQSTEKIKGDTMHDPNDNIPGLDSCDEGTNSTARIKDQAAATVEEIKGTARDVKEQLGASGKRTVDQINAQREPAAKTLESAARRLHEGGERVSAAASRAAGTTADKLQTTADYIRENDISTMMDDVQDIVRRHPGVALAVAAAAGLLVGKAIRGRKS